MANEFKHVSVGTEITQAEYEGTAGHVFNSQATGDIMYASSSSQLTRLGIGSTNAVLTVSGGIPAWDTTWTPAGDLLPSADDSYDLGSASAAWQDLFLEGDITLTDAGTIATSAGALTVNGAGGINLQEGGATIIGISDSRAVSTSNTASVDLDASGAIQINSSGGALSVGNDNVDQNVNIATAGTRTLNIGINDGTDLTTITSKGNITNTGTLTVGVDDTGYDVKFFGASAGAYMEWDESADQLRIVGPSADATTSTGKLLLATALTDINANDVIGKIDFQAPLEAGGTDAIAIAASIQAVAQATFSSSVNSTDLLFMTGDSEAATEKFRITSQGELGVGGANYGSSGDVLTSGGAGSAPSWATPTTGDITGVTAGNGLSGGGTSGGVSLALDLSELTDTAIAHGDYIVFTDTTDSNASVKGDLADVATLFAGTSLTATNSVIAVDDVFLRNDASDTTSGTVTMANLIIGDAGNIGSASDTDAIAISSGGVVSFSQAVTADSGVEIDNITIDGTEIDLSSGDLTLDVAGDIILDAGGANVLAGGDNTTDLGAAATRWKDVYAQSFHMDASVDGIADHGYAGMTATLRVGDGAAVGAFDLVCISDETNEVQVADADAIATSRVIGINPSNSAISDNSEGTILLHGFVRDDTWNWTTGATLYLGTGGTGSTITATAPSGTDDCVVPIGIALEPDMIYFNPTMTIIEHA